MSTVRPMRRAKRRAETEAQIKSLALAQLAEVGASGINLRAIARDLEMSSAGIYRYYASRDELLVALIADGFESLGDALRRAIDDPGGADRDRLRAAVHGYRAWSKESPQLFSLLFTDPVPGFVAPTDGPTDLAVRSALAPLTALAAGIIDPDGPGGSNARDLPDQVLASLMSFWGAVHGFVALEVFHHLDWAGIDLDRVFDDHVTTAIGGLSSKQTT